MQGSRLISPGYYVKCFKKDVPEAVDILADILLNSKRTEQDLDAERQTIVQEKEDVEARIDEVLSSSLFSWGQTKKCFSNSISYLILI